MQGCEGGFLKVEAIGGMQMELELATMVPEAYIKNANLPLSVSSILRSLRAVLAMTLKVRLEVERMKFRFRQPFENKSNQIDQD